MNHYQTVVVNGVDYGQQMCYMRALLFDPSVSNARNNLGVTTARGHIVMITSTHCAQQQYYPMLQRSSDHVTADPRNNVVLARSSGLSPATTIVVATI